MRVGILIGGILRFIDKLNGTIFTLAPYDVFISTDRASLECARNKYVKVWNATMEITPPFPDEFKFGTTYAHAIQWWRVQRAWWMMTEHEVRNHVLFDRVVKLRTDIRPQLFPLTLVGTKMRGDWFAWGPRDAMEYHTSYLFTTYPRLVAYGVRQRERGGLIGDSVYWTLPYHKMLLHGAIGLRGHFWKWLEYPRKNAKFSCGFSALTSEHNLLKHISQNLKNLSRLCDLVCDATASETTCMTGKPFKFRSETIHPEAEKGILFHTLSGDYTFENAMPRGYSIVGSRRTQGILLPARKDWKCGD